MLTPTHPASYCYLLHSYAVLTFHYPTQSGLPRYIVLAQASSIGIDCMPAPSRGRSTILGRGMYAYLLAVGGIPVVHLLALGVVRLRERA